MPETADAILNGSPPEGPEETTPTPPEGLAAETPEATAPEAGGEQQQPSADPSQPEWLERFESRFSELRDGLSDIGVEFPQRQDQQQPQQQQAPPAEQQPQQQPYGETTEWDDSDIDPDAQAQIQSYLDRKADEAAEKRLAPFFEAENKRRTIEAAQVLEESYPELRDPRVTEPVIQAADALGNQIAEALGGDAQRLQNHPLRVALTQLFYLASKAEAAASSEGPAGEQQQEVALEAPGARAPGGTGELTEAQQIVGAGAPVFPWQR